MAMWQQALVTVVVAAATSFVTLQVVNQPNNEGPAAIDALATQLAAHPALQASFTPPVLAISTPPEEDAWLDGVGADGKPRPGPADDVKPLVSSNNAVCFLTEIDVKGFSDAGDQLACRVSIDEFTGFWELHAVQGDGTDASVRCNAQCLSIQ